MLFSLLVEKYLALMCGKMDQRMELTMHILTLLILKELHENKNSKLKMLLIGLFSSVRKLQRHLSKNQSLKSSMVLVFIKEVLCQEIHYEWLTLKELTQKLAAVPMSITQVKLDGSRS